MSLNLEIIFKQNQVRLMFEGESPEPARDYQAAVK